MLTGQAITQQDSIQVLIIEDHEVVRSGLRSALRAWRPDVQIVESDTREKTLTLIREGIRPDLVILDLMLPRVSGFDLLNDLTKNLPQTPVTVFTVEEGLSMVYGAMSRGARGYILKSMPSEQLLSALETVLSGEIFVPANVKGIGLSADKKKAVINQSDIQTEPQLDGLNVRQIEILSLIARGKSNKEISSTLNLSPATVRSYLTIIFRHLNAKNRTEASAIAQKLGLIRQ
ncbi:MAG: response regulator transcription factor [Gammaproteobacteria bacterium]|nr:response regulator transcription factor [Gammaproteobacteria bacterium]MDH5693694.1 response regulator transcription factor [Gammaproteobacteria bacterium]